MRHFGYIDGDTIYTTSRPLENWATAALVGVVRSLGEELSNPLSQGNYFAMASDICPDINQRGLLLISIADELTERGIA